MCPPSSRMGLSKSRLLATIISSHLKWHLPVIAPAWQIKHSESLFARGELLLKPWQDSFDVFQSLIVTGTWTCLCVLCALQVWPGGFVDGGSPETAASERWHGNCRSDGTEQGIHRTGGNVLRWFKEKSHDDGISAHLFYLLRDKLELRGSRCKQCYCNYFPIFCTVSTKNEIYIGKSLENIEFKPLVWY